MKTVGTRLILISRPISYLPSLAVFLAGVAYSHQPFSWVFILGAFFITFPLHLIIYGLNDISDIDSDTKNTRKGYVDGAVLQAREVHRLTYAIVFTMFVICISLVLLNRYMTVAAFLVLYAFAYTYSIKPVRLKSRPGLDSLSNGLWIYAIFIAGYWISRTDLTLAFPSLALSAAIFLIPTALHALATLLDTASDKAAGDRTIGITLGKTKTTLLATALLVISFVLAGLENHFVGTYILWCIGGVVSTLRYRSRKFLRVTLLSIIYLVPLPILLTILL